MDLQEQLFSLGGWCKEVVFPVKILVSCFSHTSVLMPLLTLWIFHKLENLGFGNFLTPIDLSELVIVIKYDVFSSTTCGLVDTVNWIAC